MDKKTKIYLVVFLCVCAVIIPQQLFFLSFGKYADRCYAIDDFLTKHENENPDFIFIGSSMMQHALNATEFERTCADNRNITAYNIATAGDTPLRRIVEMNKIINVKPKYAIYEISYQTFSPFRDLYDFHYYYVNDKYDQLDDYSKSLFDDKWFCKSKLDVLQGNRGYFDQLHLDLTKRALINKIENQDYLVDFKNPAQLTSIQDNEQIMSRVEHVSSDYQKITEKCDIEELSPKYIKENRLFLSEIRSQWTIINTDKNPQVKAFSHIVKNLNSSGSNVTVIIMPINPYLSDIIPEKTKNGLRNTLDELGYKYIDWEDKYPSEYFFDLTHLNSEGQKQFSKDIAELILNSSMGV